MSGKIKVAVIGGGGQTGPYILEHFRNEPSFEVTAVCRNEVTAGSLKMAGHRVVCFSTSDLEATQKALADTDVVVNLASASGSPGRARAQNEATVRALLSLTNTERLITFSSVAVYGSCVDASRSTFERPRPDEPYGKDKLELERTIEKLAKTSRVKATVLRLGHVYGPEQWVSRLALLIAKMPQKGLPFDGRLPSNAIYVGNLAKSLRSMIKDGSHVGTFNMIDSPTTTWRQVFDWNTSAAGLPPVPAMSDEDSEKLRQHYRALAATGHLMRFGKEMTAWARSLPSSMVQACPAVKDIGQIVLARSRTERLERFVQKWYSSSFAPSASDFPGYSIPKIGKLLSDGIPGPNAASASSIGREDSARLFSWYSTMNDPDYIERAAAGARV